MSRVHLLNHPVAGHRALRRQMAAGITVLLLLALPGAALPCALDDLLRLPLERLLQLQIRLSLVTQRSAADRTNARSGEGQPHHAC